MGVERVDLQFDSGRDRDCVWETDHLQIMRIRLEPGQALPTHNSNAEVLLVPQQGQLRLVTPATEATIGVGEALSVPYDTRMDVSNGGSEPLTFLVLKTPHPKTFLQ
jgi:quercetin dioxygenase-like cupin family protein